MIPEDLGYNQFFESSKKELGFGEFPVARVIFKSRGLYKVKNGEGEYEAKLTGKLYNSLSKEDFPVVGDWTSIKIIDEKQTQIIGVLPRKTMITRKHGDKNKTGDKSDTQILGANVDVAFIVESTDRDYSLNRFERYCAIVRAGGVKPVLILNKIDLISEDELTEFLDQIKTRLPDVEVFTTSTVKRDGLSDLKKYIQKGMTYCFLGSSGVGKSSLINEIIGEEITKTGNISDYSKRGKHVTTSRQMYFLENGGILIDNPGIREIGITDAGQGIDQTFNDISSLAKSCKFSDCTHTHEPDCAVLKAVESGELNEGKYSNFVNLKKEAEYFDMSDQERKNKERNFGKFLKKAKKDFKKYGL